jgi:HK97 family phage prohead protease
MPGAFTASLAKKLPKGVWMHNWDAPVAKTLEARELPAGDPALPPALASLGGLYVKSQFNLDTSRGRDAYSDLKFGLVDEFSIGYRTLKSTVDEETGIRQLNEVDLYEWSPVLVGANDSTQLLSLKGSPAGQTFEEHSQSVLAAVEEYAARLKGLAELRATEGRKLSPAHRERITRLKTALDTILTQSTPNAPEADVLSVMAQFALTEARLSGSLTGV